MEGSPAVTIYALSYGRDTDDNITQLGSSSTAAAPFSAWAPSTRPSVRV